MHCKPGAKHAALHAVQYSTVSPCPGRKSGTVPPGSAHRTATQTCRCGDCGRGRLERAQGLPPVGALCKAAAQALCASCCGPCSYTYPPLCSPAAPSPSQDPPAVLRAQHLRRLRQGRHPGPVLPPLNARRRRGQVAHVEVGRLGGREDGGGTGGIGALGAGRRERGAEEGLCGAVVRLPGTPQQPVRQNQHTAAFWPAVALHLPPLHTRPAGSCRACRPPCFCSPQPPLAGCSPQRSPPAPLPAAAAAPAANR